MSASASWDSQGEMDANTRKGPYVGISGAPSRMLQQSPARAHALGIVAASGSPASDKFGVTIGSPAQPGIALKPSSALGQSGSDTGSVEKGLREAARELARRERMLQRDRDRLMHEKDQLACERDHLVRERDQLACERDKLVRERDQQQLGGSVDLIPRALPYWTNMDTSVAAKKFGWPEGRQALHAMLKRMAVHACCHGRDGVFEVEAVRSVRVWWVENPILWTQYCNKAKEMDARSKAQGSQCAPVEPPVAPGLAEMDLPARLQPQSLNKSLNEVFLWHGSSKPKVDIIAEAGFDERVSSLGGMLGGGVYFAEDSCKSGQYAEKSIASSRSHWFVLSRVLLGRPHYTTAPMPEIRRAPDGSDSVVYTPDHNNGLGHHREFVIYDRFQAYPEFIVEARTA